MIQLKISEVAQARGLDLAKLSRGSELSRNTIRRYWHNRVRRVSLISLEAIASALNVSIAELFADKAYRDKPEEEQE
jgi:transcriptional regulator with XRE-family HTH domain